MTVLSQVDPAVWGTRVEGIAAVEHELARLRRVQDARAREQGYAVARAAVLNLVVYATREVHARRAAETIAGLAFRHPSRAIVVLADRPDERVEASLTLHCQAPRVGDRQLCYEQILIRASGGSDERIASAVIPVLLPDLPTFLWWTETPPLERRSFDDLLALADRFIVDSADFARPAETLSAIAGICRSGHGRYGVTDFNWARLTPWRELLAQFFDVPAWRPYLDGVVGVRTGFAVDADGREIHPSQALLLLGWLASRLGWRVAEPMAPSEAGGLLFRMLRPDGSPLWMRVRPRYERGMDEGDLWGVRIQAAADGRLAEFVVKRDIGRAQATTSVIVDGTAAAERTVRLPAPGVDELLGEELTILQSDAVYEQALQALVALA